MRIRTVKPEFFTHEALYDAESAEKLPLRIAFIGLWCAADREGRFKWEPRRLGVQILPYDQINFSRVLDVLTTRGFIVRYASDTGEFGWIPSFPRHQVINNRERDSELPNPNECKGSDACGTREPRVDHAGKAEGKGKEGNKEGKEIPPNPQGGTGKPRKRKSNPDNQRVEENTPTMIRINDWFGRRPDTLWTITEARALEEINPSEAELDGMELFYTANEDPKDPLFRRTNLITMLNNWRKTELDKARGFARKQRGAA